MFRTVNAVALGLLLNCGLTSSIDNTLLPDDSVKSVRILLLKIISSERILFPSSKSRLFSVAISKSNTQLVSTNPSKLLTIVTSVSSVDNPTEALSPADSTWRSPNFLNPRVWFVEETVSFQVSNGIVLLRE